MNSLNVVNMDNIDNLPMLIDKREERNKILENKDNIKKLEAVKEIFALGQTELMTIQMVANYFEVNKNVIELLISRNKEELEENGMKTYKRKEIQDIFLNCQDVSLEKIDRYKDKLISNEEEITVTNRGLILINKRVLLNIAMLLRDSEIAKEVRRRLLDIAQDAEQGNGSIETIVNEVYEEIALSHQLGEAMINGDLMKVMEINTKIHELKNKRIKELEVKNEELTEVIEDIIDTNISYETLRRELNANIKEMSMQLYGNYAEGWKEFYRFAQEYNFESRRTYEIKRLTKQINNLGDDIEIYEIEGNKTKVKELRKEHRELMKRFNFVSDKKKCSKLEFVREGEWENLIVKTRAWCLKNGYDWREGLTVQDDKNLPF